MSLTTKNFLIERFAAMSSAWKRVSMKGSTGKRCGLWQTLLLSVAVSTQLAPASAQTTESAQSPQTSEATPSATVLDARVADYNFGYVIGDLLVQRVALPSDVAQPDISLLTEDSRVSTWLERQGASLAPGDDGGSELTIRYQIVNAPLTIVHAALPELALSSSVAGDGEASAPPELFIPAWPFTLGPLTAGNQPTASANSQSGDDAGNDSQRSLSTDSLLRPDHVLSPLDTSTPARRLRIALLLLAGTMLAWAGWFVWRLQRDVVRLPFSKAAQLLKQQHRQSTSDTDAETSWQILHHAFNQSAGHVVTARNLSSLYDSQPWLQTKDRDIRDFFASSAARHFELPAREPTFAMDALASALAKAEKSHSY